MKFKKSKNAVKKNGKIWIKSLKTFEHCQEIQDIELPLSEFNKLPNQKEVIGRFYALAKVEKLKNKRFNIISKELCNLWIKLNIKQMRVKAIIRKIEKLILCYQKKLKRSYNYCFNNIFDITSERESESEPEPESNQESNDGSDLSMMSADELDDDIDYNYEPVGRQKPPKCSIKPAVTLVNQGKLSTRKTSKICKLLAVSGVAISTPSQSGVYKAVIKSAEQKEELYKTTLKNDDWCLHFDGKKIEKKEVQVIVIKNEFKEIKLAVLVLQSGKAVDIFNGIKQTLNKFDLWKSIQMIICDTTNVNTGKKNGIVTLLQNYYQSMSIPPPQFIGCQHHVLDLVLRHVMDEVLDGKTSSPNISYNFVTELLNNYEDLKRSYNQNDVLVKCINLKWRDDMQFLYELGNAFRYFEKNGRFPYINFKSLPPISNARWNSRAIYAILAFILLPTHQETLHPICKFICDVWYDIWFSNHCFHKNNFSSLNNSLINFKKAHESFLRHWVPEPSKIPNQQRSNICAERAVKIVQDIFPLCKTTRTLNLKFISYNN